MFEREIREASTVTRWGIVRTLRQQSIADHQYYVAMYANDIAAWLGLSTELHLSLLQQSLWHDLKDEIFTNDITGPAKRKLMPDKEKTSAICQGWFFKIFGVAHHRTGHVLGSKDQTTIHLILKIADELDAACEMATEVQFGNQNCKPRILPPLERAKKQAILLCDYIGRPDLTLPLTGKLSKAVADCEVCYSRNADVLELDDA
jgi:5'-deoxynucleotidase YfbR-like HD superfamily hydrolase